MTIFDYLEDIIVKKTGSLLLDQYNPYLINRWLSFINPVFAETTNVFNSSSLLEDKNIHYKTMLAFFPKAQKMPKINYCKKLQENPSIQENLSCLASQIELSTREISQMNFLIESLSSSNISQI